MPGLSSFSSAGAIGASGSRAALDLVGRAGSLDLSRDFFESGGLAMDPNMGRGKWRGKGRIALSRRDHGLVGWIRIAVGLWLGGCHAVDRIRACVRHHDACAVADRFVPCGTDPPYPFDAGGWPEI